MGQVEGKKISDIVEYLEQEQLDFRVIGDINMKIVGFSSISKYTDGTITWIKNKENLCKVIGKITACVVQEGVDVSCPVQIVSKESKAVFFAILEHFFDNQEQNAKMIGEYTYIGPNVILGENVRIGNNCSISGQVNIGKDTVISDNVVIRNKVTIGEKCHIQALSVIGEDGFSYTEDADHNKTMVKHHGGVQIGNNVFIGTHVNIARGTIDDTCISDGVKIAPSTHIGHNNQIGKNTTVICTQSYGSVEMGENAYVVGSILRNQCKIGHDTIIGMGSVVTKDVEAGKVAMGTPAKVVRDNN